MISSKPNTFPMNSHSYFKLSSSLLLVIGLLFSSCQGKKNEAAVSETDSLAQDSVPKKQLPKPISEPLVTHIYTADPSAHVFNGRIYIYPSHDIESNTPQDDEGGHFDMKDYHILSMDSVGGKVTDHGVALDIKDVPWAGRQMWAPDAAFKNGKYYLYFPVKDKKDVFHIGVATGAAPEGPFKAEPNYIKGSYSIDPAVFTDATENPICILVGYGVDNSSGGVKESMIPLDLKPI